MVLSLSKFLCTKQFIWQNSVRWSKCSQIKLFSTDVKTSETQELYSVNADVEESLVEDLEAEIELKRNKSRLSSAHLNVLHGRVPYRESKVDYHNSLKYKRRMFGRYGLQSNIDPSTLWPTKEEITEALEYERVAYPDSFHEMVAKETQKKVDEEIQIAMRQKRIAENMKKLNQWKKDLEEKTAKKLADAAAAKAKKDALIEEVRRHFGFKIDPKDERFKELLLQKEKAQKKKLKEERAKAKQEKLYATLLKNESR